MCIAVHPNVDVAISRVRMLLFADAFCKVPGFAVVRHYSVAVCKADLCAVGKCCYACYCGGIRLRAGISQETSQVHVFQTAVQQFAQRHVGKVCQNAADFTVDNFTDSEVLYFVKYGIEGTSRNVCNAQVYKCAVQRGHFGVVQTVFYKFFIGCAGVVARQNGRVVPNKTVAVVAVHVVLFRAGKFRLVVFAVFFLDQTVFAVNYAVQNVAVWRGSQNVIPADVGNFVADTTQQTSHIGVVDDVVHVDFAVFAHKVDNQRVAKQRGKRACLTTQQVGDFHLSQGFQRSAVLQLQKQTVVTAKRGVQFAYAGLSHSPHKGVVAVGVGGEVFRQQL